MNYYIWFNILTNIWSLIISITLYNRGKYKYSIQSLITGLFSAFYHYQNTHKHFIFPLNQLHLSDLILSDILVIDMLCYLLTPHKLSISCVPFNRSYYSEKHRLFSFIHYFAIISVIITDIFVYGMDIKLMFRLVIPFIWFIVLIITIAYYWVNNKICFYSKKIHNILFGNIFDYYLIDQPEYIKYIVSHYFEPNTALLNNLGIDYNLMIHNSSDQNIIYIKKLEHKINVNGSVYYYNWDHKKILWIIFFVLLEIIAYFNIIPVNYNINHGFHHLCSFTLVALITDKDNISYTKLRKLSDV